MNKQPFNASGFLRLQEQLQQLPAHALQAEVQKIRTDLTDWILANFELKDRQIDFLKNLDERFVNYTAEQTAFAISNNRPITLAKADPPKEGDEQGKIIYTKSSLRASNAASNGFSAGGELIIEISYNN